MLTNVKHTDKPIGFHVMAQAGSVGTCLELGQSIRSSANDFPLPELQKGLGLLYVPINLM